MNFNGTFTQVISELVEQVFRLLPVPDRPVDEVVERPLVPLEQRLECRSVSCVEPPQELLVGEAGLIRFHRRGPPFGRTSPPEDLPRPGASVTEWHRLDMGAPIVAS